MPCCYVSERYRLPPDLWWHVMNGGHGNTVYPFVGDLVPYAPTRTDAKEKTSKLHLQVC